MDVDKQIEYWRFGAEEALDYAIETIDRGRINFGLFFAHLALEKALKANVVKITAKTPPYIHNLISLAKICKFELSEEEFEFLEEMTGWNLSGRYSDRYPILPDKDRVDYLMKYTGSYLKWLIEKL